MVTNLYLIKAKNDYVLCYVPKIGNQLGNILNEQKNVSLEDLVQFADEKKYQISNGKLKPSLEHLIKMCCQYSIKINNVPSKRFVEEYKTGKYDEIIKYIIENKQTKLKRVYNFFKHYKNKIYFAMTNFTLKFQKTNSKALTSTLKSDDVNLLYSPKLDKEQAVSIYNKILKKEWRKNVAMFTLNSLMLPIVIPLGWLTPLAVVPATTVPFILMWYHSFNVLRAVRRSNVKFKPDDNARLLEEALHNKNKHLLTNEELIKCYEMLAC